MGMHRLKQSTEDGLNAYLLKKYKDGEITKMIGYTVDDVVTMLLDDINATNNKNKFYTNLMQ
jgi:hypothetical protein